MMGKQRMPLCPQPRLCPIGCCGKKITLAQYLFVKALSPCNRRGVPSCSSYLGPLGVRAGERVGHLRAPGAPWGSQPPGALSWGGGAETQPVAFSFLAAAAAFLPRRCHAGKLFYLPTLDFLIHKTETKNVLVKGVTGPSESPRALKSSC